MFTVVESRLMPSMSMPSPPPTQVIKPVEYVKRPHRLGLGATPAAPPTSDKKVIKPGETRETPKDLVYVDPSGQHKSVKTIDDALVERPKEGLVVGKRMHIIDGKHRGCVCVVVAVEAREEGRSGMGALRETGKERGHCEQKGGGKGHMG